MEGNLGQRVHCGLHSHLQQSRLLSERLIGATIHVNGQVVGTVSNAEGADMSRFEFTGLNLVTNQVEIVGGTEGAALEALSLAEVEVFVRETSSSRCNICGMYYF